MSKSKKKVDPQPRKSTEKAAQQGGTPRTGFDDEGAKGHGAKVMMGAPGPLAGSPDPRGFTTSNRPEKSDRRQGIH